MQTPTKADVQPIAESSTTTVPTSTTDGLPSDGLVPVADVRVVALHPSEMETSQQKTIAWVAAKIRDLGIERDEFEANLNIAIKNKWNTARPKSHLSRVVSRIKYYEKLKAALVAGYFIVPAFPGTVFAVRTTKQKPNTQWHEASHSWGNVVPVQEAMLLPVGKGEYVNPALRVMVKKNTAATPENKEPAYYHYSEPEFPDIDFPFVLAKPTILDATQRAMALKIFDDISVAPPVNTAKKDPMVLGRIFAPKAASWAPRPSVTFLIAWFLDLKTL